MTPFQYYARWTAILAVGFVIEYFVVKWAVLAALRTYGADRLLR